MYVLKHLTKHSSDLLDLLSKEDIPSRVARQECVFKTERVRFDLGSYSGRVVLGTKRRL